MGLVEPALLHQLPGAGNGTSQFAGHGFRHGYGFLLHACAERDQDLGAGDVPACGLLGLGSYDVLQIAAGALPVDDRALALPERFGYREHAGTDGRHLGECRGLDGGHHVASEGGTGHAEHPVVQG